LPIDFPLSFADCFAVAAALKEKVPFTEDPELMISQKVSKNVIASVAKQSHHQ